MRAPLTRALSAIAAAVFAMLLVGVGGASAQASSSWTPGSPVSALGVTCDGCGNETAVAASANGHFVSVWDQPIVSGSSAQIFAASSADGVHWSAPVAISDVGDYHTPSVAMDASGHAVAVWDDNNQRIWTAETADGTSWQPFEQLGDVGRVAGDPSIRVTPAGAFVAAWVTEFHTQPFAVSATKHFGSSWSTAQVVSGSNDDAQTVTLENEPAGGCVMSWFAYGDTGGPNSIGYAESADCISWSNPVTVVTNVGELGSPPQLRKSAAGRIVIGYHADIMHTNTDDIVTSTDGTTWSSPTMLSSSNSGEVFVTLNRADQFVVSWLEGFFTGQNIHVSTTTDGQTIEHAQIIATGNFMVGPYSLFSNDLGTTLVAWYSDTSDGVRSLSVRSSADGATWSDAVQMTPLDDDSVFIPTSYPASMAATPDGYNVLVWNVARPHAIEGVYSSALDERVPVELASTGAVLVPIGAVAAALMGLGLVLVLTMASRRRGSA